MPQVPTRLVTHVLTAARVAGPSDRALLRRYARGRDQAAFAELVRRHGPMVLGAATRVLGRDPAAEDAFQLAFAALARAARTIRTGSVAGWLHRTTIRSALRLRAKKSVPPGLPHEQPGPTAEPFADVAWREVRQVVDAELNTLPDRLRVPLVLCYLEALTRDEAASRLGWSLRTLERRLGQGRAILLRRLNRRGVTGLGAVAVATAGGLTLPVPAALAEAVVRSAPRPAVPLTFTLALTAVAIISIGIALGLSDPRPGGDPPAKATPPVAKDVPPIEAPDVPLPPGAVRRFGSLAWRHPGGISEAVLSADSKTLVTVGQGTLAVWDVPTGRRVFYSRELDLFNAFEPGAAAVAPDGSWAAYLSRSKAAVRVIEPATGKERLTVGPLGEAPGRPPNLISYRSVRVPADGKTILLCDDQTLIAYDATAGKEQRKVRLPGRVIDLTPDGRRAIVHNQTDPAQAFVYDLDTGKQVVQLDGPFQKPGANSWFIRAAVAADGKRVATLSDLDPEIRLWDADTGKLLTTLKRARPPGPTDDHRLVTVALSADGKTVYAGGMAGHGVVRWDAATGKELDPWSAGFGPIGAVVVGRDTAFTCSNDGLIGRREAATGREQPAPTGHTEVTRATRSPDGRTVVTADHTGRLLVWDAATGKLARSVTLAGAMSGPPFAFRPDGKMFAATEQVGRVVLFDPATWKSAGEIKLPGGDQEFIRGLRFLPDGSGLIVHHGQDRIERRDFGADKPRWSLTEQVLALAVSTDGKHFAVSVGKGVSVRSLADGMELRLIPAVADPDTNVVFPIRVDAMAFSPDGTLVAGTRWDKGDVWVWDVASGKEVRRLAGHRATEMNPRIGETSVAFAADGRWLATGHADHMARIWELSTGKEARRLMGHDAIVSGVEFARDGRTLLTTAGLEVLLWDLTAGADKTADLEALWTDLGSDDATKAYRAAAGLAVQGDKAVELLQKKLPPVPAVEAAKLARRVAELDSDEFRAREAARRALGELGPLAGPALQAGLAKKPSAEGRTRIEELLDRLRRPLSGTDARPGRAVQALQWLGTDAAQTVLKAWAAGAPGARLTEEAGRGLQLMD